MKHRRHPVAAFFRRVFCQHEHEVDAQVAGTGARVRCCPVCLHITWVD